MDTSGASRPATRLLAMLEILQARGTVSGRELAERLEVEPRTVRRYAVKLEELDIPVEAERGPYGGYRLRPGFRDARGGEAPDPAVGRGAGAARGRRPVTGPLRRPRGGGQDARVARLAVHRASAGRAPRIAPQGGRSRVRGRVAPIDRFPMSPFESTVIIRRKGLGNAEIDAEKEY